MELDEITKRPIWEKYLRMVQGNRDMPIWDRYKGLVMIVVLCAGFIVTWTRYFDGFSRSGHQVEVNTVRLDRAERRIIEIEKFIAAQAEINGQLKEMKTDLKELTNYLLNNHSAQ